MRGTLGSWLHYGKEFLLAMSAWEDSHCSQTEEQIIYSNGNILIITNHIQTRILILILIVIILLAIIVTSLCLASLRLCRLPKAGWQHTRTKAKP